MTDNAIDVHPLGDPDGRLAQDGDGRSFPPPTPLSLQTLEAAHPAAASGHALTLAASGGMLSYLHSYSNIDNSSCGQAAIATVLDHLGVELPGITRTVTDASDGRKHWDNQQAVSLIKNRYPPDVVFGLCGTSGGRITDAIRDHGFAGTDVMYAGLGTSWQDLWATLQSYVASGGICPVLLQADLIPGYSGFLNMSGHWPVIFRIDASGAHLANCAGNTIVMSVNRFLEAWNYLAFNPAAYGYNHCAVLAAN